MELQEVEVIIHPDERMELEVRGVQGARCLDITKDLEAALGNHIESREMTADALAAPVQKQTPVSAHTGRCGNQHTRSADRCTASPAPARF